MSELSNVRKLRVGDTDIEFSLSDEFLSLARKELGLSPTSDVDDNSLKTLFSRILVSALDKAEHTLE